jgi:hypothetical protein
MVYRYRGICLGGESDLLSGVSGFDVSVNRLIGIAAGKAAQGGLGAQAVRPAAGVEAGEPFDPRGKSELTDEERAQIAELAGSVERVATVGGGISGSNVNTIFGPTDASRSQNATSAGLQQGPISQQVRNNSAALSNDDNHTSATAGSVTGDAELTEEEQAEVENLKNRDAEVRRHEQAHKAAAGAHAKGGPKFEIETGPDGQQYAVGGHVDVDTSPVQGDPQATIAKMQQIRRAALAPAEPSSKDRQVAAKAAQQEREARAELAESSLEYQDFGNAGTGNAPEADGAARIRAAFGGGNNTSTGRFIDVAA